MTRTSWTIRRGVVDIGVLLWHVLVQLYGKVSLLFYFYHYTFLFQLYVMVQLIFDLLLSHVLVSALCHGAVDSWPFTITRSCFSSMSWCSWYLTFYYHTFLCQLYVTVQLVFELLLSHVLVSALCHGAVDIWPFTITRSCVSSMSRCSWYLSFYYHTFLFQLYVMVQLIFDFLLSHVLVSALWRYVDDI